MVGIKIHVTNISNARWTIKQGKIGLLSFDFSQTKRRGAGSPMATRHALVWERRKKIPSEMEVAPRYNS